MCEYPYAYIGFLQWELKKMNRTLFSSFLLRFYDKNATDRFSNTVSSWLASSGAVLTCCEAISLPVFKAVGLPVLSLTGSDAVVLPVLLTGRYWSCYWSHVVKLICVVDWQWRCCFTCVVDWQFVKKHFADWQVVRLLVYLCCWKASSEAVGLSVLLTGS